MLCGNIPCTCFVRAKKQASQPKVKPTVQPVKPAAKPGAPAWSAAAANRPERTPAPRTGPSVVEPVSEPRPTAHAPTRPLEQLLEEEALRTLVPLMSKQDQDKYRMIITSELSPQEALQVWKARRTDGRAS